MKNTLLIGPGRSRLASAPVDLIRTVIGSGARVTVISPEHEEKYSRLAEEPLVDVLTSPRRTLRALSELLEREGAQHREPHVLIADHPLRFESLAETELTAVRDSLERLADLDADSRSMLFVVVDSADEMTASGFRAEHFGWALATGEVPPADLELITRINSGHAVV